MTQILPRKKQKILAYLKEYIREHGYAPTLTEISHHFRLSSPATVHEHLEYLEKHGFISRHDNQLQIIDRAANDGAENTEVEYLAGSAVELPIAGLITAGAPIEAIEDATATLTVPSELARRRNSYVLKVKGDSMIESCIADGDFVIVEKQDYAQNGDIVVALLDDGSATLKEYHKEKHYVRLQPRNFKYQPLRVKNVVIQGKVTGIIRAFN